MLSGPSALAPPAWLVVPDALDSIVGVDSSDATVSLPYEGYRVVVSTSGTIEPFADD